MQGLDTGFDGKLRCPSCGSSDVRRSHSHSLLDGVMLKFRRSPFRCRLCQRRFFSQHTPKPEQVLMEDGRRTGSAANPNVE